VKSGSAAAALALAACAVPANAGPPYLTDDPAPTETGHWEIYAFTAGEGRRARLDDDSGLDLNYGAVKDVQLTATVPLSIAHEPGSGWRSGTGDLELAVKYRLVNDERSGVSVAVFPRAILPTSSIQDGERTRLLLPVWLEKDFAGGTSIFGGGGFEVNPGAGNRNFWQAGVAVTQDVGKTLSVGAELTRQGADAVGGAPETSAGVGTIVKLGGPYALLLSAGPTWSGHQTSYHFYGALGLDF
jgi:hypothetical protein